MQQSLLARGNPLRRIWAAYERQLERHPVATQVATSGLLWGVGDLLAQRIEHAEQQQQQRRRRAAPPTPAPGAAPGGGALAEDAASAASSAAAAAQPPHAYDWRRAALTGVFGATFVGPVGHYWYLGLDRWCAARFRAGTAAFIAAKVVLDTATMGPFYVASFFGFGTAVIDGGGFDEFARKMRTDFWPTLAAEVTFWPFVQTVNFARVPVQHQLLVVNTMTILDAAFMSWARNQQDWSGRLIRWLQGRAATGDQERQQQQQQQHGSEPAAKKAHRALPTVPLQLPGPAGSDQPAE